MTAIAESAETKNVERRALGVACGAHALHDGYTELIYVLLPLWQAEFGLSYAAAGMLRTTFSGTMASLQIPASLLAERLSPAIVLAAGTALCGFCYVLAGISGGAGTLGAAVRWLLLGTGSLSLLIQGGTIAVRSEAGQGSTFTVTFPLAAESA